MKLEENDYYKFCHVTGVTKFQGCQCFKDCTCHEDFKSENYEYWTVTNKKSKRFKRTRYYNIEDAKERINQILAMYKINL